MRIPGQPEADYAYASDRPGTTKLLENNRVLVWDISWLKQQYPLHRHPYDLTGVYYTDGDRMIVSQTGERRPVHTAAWWVHSDKEVSKWQSK